MFNKILSWVSLGAVLASYLGTQLGSVKPALGQTITAIAGGVLAFTKSILPQSKDNQ